MLIDELLCQKKLESELHQGIIDSAREILEHAKVIRADNVAEYLYLENGKEIWDMATDFPSILPPFELTWFEWTRPKMSNSEGKMVDLDRNRIRLGVLFKVFDIREIQRRGAVPGFVSEKARWIVRAAIFMGVDSDRIVPLPLEVQYLVGEGGEYAPIWNKEKGKGEKIMVKVYDKELRDNGVPPSLHATLFVPFLAMSFCNCRNVELVRTEDGGVSPRLNRARERRGKKRLVSFYTLEIEGIRRRLEGEGKRGEVGLQKALHICRGHFADYREGKGLFGRVHGRFWRSESVRGSSESGVVWKDWSPSSPSAMPPLPRAEESEKGKK